MAQLVTASNISEAWLLASWKLLNAQGSTLTNLCINVSNPAAETQAIRDRLEEFRVECLDKGLNSPLRIQTVASTIFPKELYRESAANPARHLFDLERMIRSAINRVPQNRRGTYFQRLVAFRDSKPDSSETLNQLEAVLTRLEWSKRHGHKNGNRYELAIFDPKRDNNLQGFPCLSHISLTLSGGALSATALYRNQYFINRAYGNLLGLANLLSFLASESGFRCGELLAIASHARLEVGEFGKRRLKQLLSNCDSANGGSG